MPSAAGQYALESKFLLAAPLTVRYYSAAPPDTLVIQDAGIPISRGTTAAVAQG